MSAGLHVVLTFKGIDLLAYGLPMAFCNTTALVRPQALCSKGCGLLLFLEPAGSLGLTIFSCFVSLQSNNRPVARSRLGGGTFLRDFWEKVDFFVCLLGKMVLFARFFWESGLFHVFTTCPGHVPWENFEKCD